MSHVEGPGAIDVDIGTENVEDIELEAEEWQRVQEIAKVATQNP